MVRIKHRYLLVNILYPEPPTSQPHQPLDIPDSVSIYQPTSDELTPQLLAKAMRDQILLMYGDYGAGVTSTGLLDTNIKFCLLVKYLSAATSTAIIRCSRANYQVVWAALTYMTHLPRLPDHEKLQPCVMQVIRVSGTIRKAEEEIIRRARAAILKARRESQDEERVVLDQILGPDNEGILSNRPERDEVSESGIEDVEDDDENEEDGNQETMDEDD
ncbi:MAG: hypothetical protein Q9204_000195 [Flavoplaca sp. TL-2023a]